MIAGAAVMLGVSCVILIVGCSLLHLPQPWTLLRLTLSRPSEIGNLLPAREVAASTKPRPLRLQLRAFPKRILWKTRFVSLPAFLQQTRTNAFLMLQNGVIVHQWYKEGYGPETRFPSWSVAKSIVSLLAGQAIADGRLHESDQLTTALPGARYGKLPAGVTVGHLLDMTSGIAIEESYSPWNLLTGTTGLFLSTNLELFVANHPETEFMPGERGQYRSIDTALLGLTLLQARGRTLSMQLQQQLWKPIGAERPASWNLDCIGGVEKAFCCINAVARDFAKIGQLILDHGKVGQVQVAPGTWIDRIETAAPRLLDGWQYSARWWQPPGDADDFAAIGIYGQYIYVDPRHHVVIVKLSDYGAEQDEAETIGAFRALVAAEH